MRTFKGPDCHPVTTTFDDTPLNITAPSVDCCSSGLNLNYAARPTAEASFQPDPVYEHFGQPSTDSNDSIPGESPRFFCLFIPHCAFHQSRPRVVWITQHSSCCPMGPAPPLARQTPQAAVPNTYCQAPLCPASVFTSWKSLLDG